MKIIIKNCPSCYIHNRFICGLTYKRSGFRSESESYRLCKDITDCLLKRIVELCKEETIINCNIDGKEQVLRAYYHTHIGDKILEMLEIEECENEY